MRRLLAILLITILPLALNARTLDEANASFENFVRLSRSGVSGGELYSAVLECFDANYELLDDAMANSVEEVTAKNNLKTIWPYLFNAAVFYQQDDEALSVKFAKAYIDIPLLSVFSRVNFEKNGQYSMIVYYVASKLYNSKDYKGAIKYFKEYLSTGDKSHRQNVFYFMSQACDFIQDFSLSQRVVEQALAEYPNDFYLLSRAINNCIDNGDNPALLSYLDRALAIRPNDKDLLAIQGRAFENTGNFERAALCYENLKIVQPNNLNVYKHLAGNYYNLAAVNFNDGSMDKARESFKTAIPLLEEVTAADPTSIDFLECLAIAYNYTGNESGFTRTNEKLISYGAAGISRLAEPEVVSVEGKKKRNDFDIQMSGEIPTFPDYAKGIITPVLEKWQAKDPYETISEYQQRVNPESRQRKIAQLTDDAIESYVKRYSQVATIADFQLKPYDAENEVFLAESRFGEVIIPVPRANNEARNFEMGWGGVSVSDIKYYVDGDRLAIKTAKFTTPSGKSYFFDNSQTFNYSEAVVNIDFGDFDYAGAQGLNQSSSRSRINKSTLYLGDSDVDTNIPHTNVVNSKTFAVVIANENYNMVAHVPMALNDGRTFAQYCTSAFGIPENNVRVYEDATFGTMLGAIRELKNISSAFNGDIRILFYYSGHGIPDESSRDAFLLPVDADGTNPEVCYPISRLYRELGDLKAEYELVFMDACFSGANKTGDMLSSSSRGVAIVAKPNQPQGNMISFSAASGNETAYPYNEKGHGLFTYFLLKKIQETSGNLTLKELRDYVTENVRREAVLVNHKPQTPVLTPSVSMEEIWKQINFK